jgi:hypothetical protein
MNNLQIRLVVVMACIILPAYANADDYCDEAFVTNSLIAIQDDDNFKSCELAKLKVQEHKTALKLVELLKLIQDSQSESAGEDSEGGFQKIDFTQSVTEITKSEAIDQSSDSGLKELKKWAANVSSLLKGPKNNIMKHMHGTATAEIKQARCEVKYRWRKLQLTRNQILTCVGKELNKESDVSDGENHVENPGITDATDTPETME